MSRFLSLTSTFSERFISCFHLYQMQINNFNLCSSKHFKKQIRVNNILIMHSFIKPEKIPKFEIFSYITQKNAYNQFLVLKFWLFKFIIHRTAYSVKSDMQLVRRKWSYQMKFGRYKFLLPNSYKAVQVCFICFLFVWWTIFRDE